jgi:hypothetical protein
MTDYISSRRILIVHLLSSYIFSLVSPKAVDGSEILEALDWISVCSIGKSVPGSESSRTFTLTRREQHCIYHTSLQKSLVIRSITHHGESTHTIASNSLFDLSSRLRFSTFPREAILLSAPCSLLLSFSQCRCLTPVPVPALTLHPLPGCPRPLPMAFEKVPQDRLARRRGDADKGPELGRRDRRGSSPI